MTSPFPRDTLLLALGYLTPMLDWEKVKDTTNENLQEEGDIFGFGDFGGEDIGPDAASLAPSHFLTLTCIREIFNIMTPMIAMDENSFFEPLEEEHLALFKLTDTLNFTLSLSLKFHGEQYTKKTTNMLEMLSNIRFLKGLKLQGLLSIEDFVQIGKMPFLQKLELMELRSITDEFFTRLAQEKQSAGDTIFPLKSLSLINMSSKKRFNPKVSFPQIPLFAPHLESLTLVDDYNTNYSYDFEKNEKPWPPSILNDSFLNNNDVASSTLQQQRDFLRSIKSLTVHSKAVTYSWFKEQAAEFVSNPKNLISTNLTNLDLRYVHTFTEHQLALVAKHSRQLKTIKLCAGSDYSANIFGVLGKYCGETLESISFILSWMYFTCRYYPYYVLPPKEFCTDNGEKGGDDDDDDETIDQENEKRFPTQKNVSSDTIHLGLIESYLALLFGPQLKSVELAGSDSWLKFSGISNPRQTGDSSIYYYTREGSELQKLLQQIRDGVAIRIEEKLNATREVKFEIPEFVQNFYDKEL